VLITDVDDEEEIPTEFSLSQNYPNPFNPSTTIRYSVPPSGTRSRPDGSRDGGLPEKAHVRLEMFNVLGQWVASLVDEVQEAGYHFVRFDGTGLASGLFFYRLRAGDFVETKRFLLLR